MPKVRRGLQNGEQYERHLSRARPAARKSAGVYYTPPELARFVVRQTLGPLVAGKSAEEIGRLRILDPACGCGAFLTEAFRFLSEQVQSGQKYLIQDCVQGIDIDPKAVVIARMNLAELVGVDMAKNIRCGNALDTNPERQRRVSRLPAPLSQCPHAFDAVLGNPPWGQKAVAADAGVKRRLRERFPSTAGIFDLFRPFVELGVRLTRSGGRFGMVLPDIVLLKNYEETRRLLLNQLTLERIDWWGRAFTSAVIDTATIIGTRQPVPPDHRVQVEVHDPEGPLTHSVPQADFRANPRCTFNLHLTPARRQLLRPLADCLRLGEFFEIHEGVHSGNLRAELFVAKAVDGSCRPLYFGRDEIAPYRLRWQGKLIRLAAAPERKTAERYANLGRPEWHERPKLLVRRTGDRVLAAVDRHGYHASNNFFLVFPKQESGLDLDGLCALLNSRFMTWYFRAVEPRQGRVFAELKIKHLRDFPLPRAGHHRLNELGRRCAAAAEAGVLPELQDDVDRLAAELLGMDGACTMAEGGDACSARS